MDGQGSSLDGKPKTIFADYVEKHGLFATISEGLRECFVRRLDHPRQFLSEHFSNESLGREHQLTKTEIENFGLRVRELTERALNLENDELKLKTAVFGFRRAIDLLSNKWNGPDQAPKEVNKARQATSRTSHPRVASVETQESHEELESPNYEEHVTPDNMKTGSTLQTNEIEENPIPVCNPQQVPTPRTKKPKRINKNTKFSYKNDASGHIPSAGQQSARLKRKVTRNQGPGYYRSLSACFERKPKKPRM